MIKVLVVDDSALMRREISKMIEGLPGMEVVGTCPDGRSVLSKSIALEPDIITLDVEMPEMDGLEALEKLMKNNPTAVIMISAITEEGAEATLKALELGAFDFMQKPSGSISLDISLLKEQLAAKIKTAHKHAHFHLSKFKYKHNKKHYFQRPEYKSKISESIKNETPHIVGIGVSTGGPITLTDILPQLPHDLNASILVAQHMPEKFTKIFSKRLNSICDMVVKEAEDGEIVEKGHIYIAKGGKNMVLVSRSKHIKMIQLIDSDYSRINCPNVNVLFASLNKELKGHWLGIILTGMGKDGCVELKKLHDQGGHTIAESEQSCTVFGMPKRAIEAGGVEFILPAEHIPNKIIQLFRRHKF